MTRARLLRSASLTFVAVALAAACDLNPQPLPPGEQSDGGTLANGPGGPSGSGSSSGSGSGGSGSSGSDASTPPIVVNDGGGVPSLDSGSAADASLDAQADASGDGATDAATDGSETDAALDAGDAGD